MSISDLIIGAESGGDPTASNPHSSASGLGQFIDSTWVSMLRQHRPDLADGKSDDQLVALKSNPDLSREMTAAYAADNGAILQKNGLPVTPGNTYLAHFAGPQGAVSVLRSDPGRPVSEILEPAVIKANPFLANMTAADLQAWANSKMGGTANSPAPPQAAPQSAPSAPTPSMPAQPYFAPQQPAPAPQAPAGAPYVPPSIQPAQIQYAPRRPVDLSALRAQLAQAPFYSQG